jgi:hypothetical protein
VKSIRLFTVNGAVLLPVLPCGDAGSINARRDPLTFAEWRSLFRNRIIVDHKTFFASDSFITALETHSVIEREIA